MKAGFAVGCNKYFEALGLECVLETAQHCRLVLDNQNSASVHAAAPSHDILASTDISAARLTEIIPVEQDLTRRHLRVTELDLRFRDQIIARLP